MKGGMSRPLISRYNVEGSASTSQSLQIPTVAQTSIGPQGDDRQLIRSDDIIFGQVAEARSLERIEIMKASEFVEAVYEHGVFTPSAPVELSDGQKVLLSIEPVNGKPAAAPCPSQPRRPGWGKGIITDIAEDFDAPLEDFKEYME